MHMGCEGLLGNTEITSDASLPFWHHYCLLNGIKSMLQRDSSYPFIPYCPHVFKKHKKTLTFKV